MHVLLKINVTIRPQKKLVYFKIIRQTKINYHSTNKTNSIMLEDWKYQTLKITS